MNTDFRWRRVDSPDYSRLISSSDLFPVKSLSIGSQLVYSAGDPLKGEVPFSFINSSPVAEMRVGEVACLYNNAVDVDSEGHTYIKKSKWAYGEALSIAQKDGDGCSTYALRIERTETGFQATVLTQFMGLRTRKIDFTDEKYYRVVSLAFPKQPYVPDPILNEHMPRGYEYPRGVVLSENDNGARMPSAYLANLPLAQLKAGETGFLGRDAVALDKDRRMYIVAEAEIYGTSVREQTDKLRPEGLNTKDAPFVVLRLEDGYHVYALHGSQNNDQNYYTRASYRWGMIPESLGGNAEFVPVVSLVVMRGEEVAFFSHLNGEAVQVPWKFVAP